MHIAPRFLDLGTDALRGHVSHTLSMSNNWPYQRSSQRLLNFDSQARKRQALIPGNKSELEHSEGSKSCDRAGSTTEDIDIM